MGRAIRLSIALGLIGQGVVFSQTPVIVGVVNDASGTEFSPGMHVWIAGTNFDSAATVQVGGRSVTVLERLPWLSPTGRIGDLLLVQLPVDLPAAPTTLVVTSGGVSSAAFEMRLDLYAPAFSGAQGARGNRIAHVLTTGFAPVRCDPLETAKPGETLAAYAIGLGATDPVVPNGIPAPAVPLAHTLVKPSVVLDDQVAEVVSSVLVPGEIGVYRVTFQVPSIGNGLHSLLLGIGGKRSKELLLPVGEAIEHIWGIVAARESQIMASGCGGYLAAPGTQVMADARNPPATLGGASVKVTDSTGVERPAQMLSVFSNQITYIVPPGTATGHATVKITSGGGSVSVGRLEIEPVVPRVFEHPISLLWLTKSAPAAVVVRLRDGVQTVEQVTTEGSYYPDWVPIDFGPETDQLFLLLFGTGLRHRSSLANVSVKIGGVDAPVEYAGPQGELAGVDQVNVRLPRSLAGRGEVQVELTVDGKRVNSGTLLFK